MWQALDIAFLLGHTALMFFLVLGWISRRTRPWHLAACLLTAASWTLLGIRYGFGYCFLTDWHWMVRQRMGKDMPQSFIKHLFDLVTGWDWDPALIDIITVTSFGLAFVLTAALNWRDWRTRKPVRAS
jgi:hypothetical protein